MNSTLSPNQKSAENLTLILRQSALQAGWPSHLVDEISVEEKDNQLVFDYPDNLKAEIEDLEYGTQKSAPKAVMQVFARRHQSQIVDSQDEIVLEALGKAGALG